MLTAAHTLGIAWREITLVLFTVLGPMGLGAYVLLSVGLARPTGRPARRARVEHMLAVPLFVAMVGFTASATHLGTPANALYVLTGVGRSPLSNEVACVVACLASCGFRWLYSFAQRPRVGALRAWSAVNAVLGSLALAGMGRAYDVSTVLTWSGTLPSCSLVLGGLGAGVPLGLLTLRLAKVGRHQGDRVARACVVGLACLAADVAVLCAHFSRVAGVATGMGTVAQVAPAYPALVAALAACAALGYALVLPAALRGRELSTRRLVAASAVVALGVGSARFGFYLLHATVGLGL